MILRLKVIMLSIIIPTLEEEKYLPFLLESIKEQEVLNYEIIIADAGSKDKTIEIAKKYNCKIVKGGLPAKGRNQGAKIAKGNLLLFLDADMILPDNSLNKFILEFNKKKLSVAGFLLQPWPVCQNIKVGGRKDILLKILYNVFYNIPACILENILPHSTGSLLIKKSLYKKIGGFDESIKLAEDHIYARKARKSGKFGILKSSKIYFSQRRFERDGLAKTYFKYVAGELYIIFFGPIKSDIFKYDLSLRDFNLNSNKNTNKK